MLVKIIIVLILTIAVGVLGFSDIGEGVFNFVDKSAAAEFAEDARDLTQIVEIYNTDQQGQKNAFAEAASTNTVAVDALTLGQLSSFLVDDDNGGFMKKPAPGSYELLTEDGGSSYLRFGEVTDFSLTKKVCIEINEIATGAESATVTAVAFGTTDGETLTAIKGAGADTAEMICVEDSGNAGKYNAFYRLGSVD